MGTAKLTPVKLGTAKFTAVTLDTAKLTAVELGASKVGTVELDAPKWGALMNRPIRTAARVPATGMVKIQASTSKPTRCQLTALKVLLQRPTPTVAPVIHMEVDTGSENCEKTSTVIAAPISMDEPRLGEW